MIFAHLADCHLGGWREPALRETNQKAFVKAIQRCLDERVDFVIIAGDLFNTALPPVEIIRLAVTQLKRLNDAGINCYFVAGSHDSSPSGKSILDVIESAGLAINLSKGTVNDQGQLVLKPVTDPKTGVSLCGLLARRNSLEKSYYESLDRTSLETLSGPKIFVFHGALSELKPDELAQAEAMPISLLPKGFDYYAGGHIHVVRESTLPGYNKVVYPGPTFPNNFAELEKLQHGSMFLVRDWNTEKINLDTYDVIPVDIDVTGMAAAQAQEAITDALPECNNAIVLLRVKGNLAQGSVGDLRFGEITSRCEGAIAVLRNTSALSGAEFEEVAIGTLDDIEEKLAEEHAGKSGLLSVGEEKTLIKVMMETLGRERSDGEKVGDYESSLVLESENVLKPILR